MKIQCDVCGKDEAKVYCVADEAALCAACDHRVHHANKLAGKHQRFSLIQPSPKQLPTCDICQEKRAFLFCQQDRAILCRDCDVSIHKANEHTKKHNRFLLTGVKLSAASVLYSSSSSSPTESSLTNASDSEPNVQPQTSINKPISASVSVSETPTNSPPFTGKAPMTGSAAVAPPQMATMNGKGVGNIQPVNGGNNDSTSSISEYLIDMLPGWQVEDFLDSSSFPSFSKYAEDDVLSLLEADLERNLTTFPPENMGFWVPQAPPPLYPPTQIPQSFPTVNMGFGAPDGSKDYLKEISNIKSSRKWIIEDNSFAVPQMNPPTTASKKSRTFW